MTPFLLSLVLLLPLALQTYGSGLRAGDDAKEIEKNERRALQVFEEVTPSYGRSDLEYQGWSWGSLGGPLRRGQGICNQKTNCFGVTPDGKIVFIIFNSRDRAVTQWTIYGGQTPVDRFVCQPEDGNMVAYSEDGVALWSSRTRILGGGFIYVAGLHNSKRARMAMGSSIGQELSWELHLIIDGPSYICRGSSLHLQSNPELTINEFLCSGEYRFGIGPTSERLVLQFASTSRQGKWITIEEYHSSPGKRAILKSDNRLSLVDASGTEVFSLDSMGGGIVLGMDGSLNIASPYNGDDINCVGYELNPGSFLKEDECICGADAFICVLDGTMLGMRFDSLERIWTETFKVEMVTPLRANRLFLQRDQNLVLLSPQNAPLWASQNALVNRVGFRWQRSWEGSSQTPSIETEGGDDPVFSLGQFNHIWEPEIPADRKVYRGEGLAVQNYWPFDRTLFLGMDDLGDFFYRDTDASIGKTWSAGTRGTGNYFVLQRDGNVVVYTYDHKPLWSTDTHGSKGAKLLTERPLDENISIKLVDVNKQEIWSPHTQPRMPDIKCNDDPWLLPGETLKRGEALCYYKEIFGLDQDGRLRNRNQVIDMGGHLGSNLVYQEDGNLVVHDADGVAIWSSRTDDGYPKGKFHFKCETIFCGRYSSNSCDIVVGDSTDEKEWEEAETYCRGNQLLPGQTLYAQEVLCSPNGQVQFGVDMFGNIATWIRGRKRTKSNAPKHYSNRLILQGDQNLVLYDNGGSPKWDSKTMRSGATALRVNDDSTVTLVKSDGSIVKQL